ncbi:MAG: hypothetical protein IPO63_01675 [Bacteroidetes bacterium]|nr:hypothetical protein [Bacteroidota bacterium]
MRLNSQIVLAISILVITFTSCEKENSGTSSTFQFKVNVDGVLLTADSAYGILHIDSSPNFNQRIFSVFGFFHKKTIFAFLTDTVNSLYLVNPNYTGWGGKMLQMTDSITGETYTSNPSFSATFNITSNDTVNKLVSGNLSGYVLDSTSTDSILISNGIFKNVKYSY